MNRMTKTLALGLIGSSLVLAGCPAPRPAPPQPPVMPKEDLDEERKEEDPEVMGPMPEGQERSHATRHHYHSSRPMVFVAPDRRVGSGFHAPAPVVSPSSSGTGARPASGSTSSASSRPGGFGTTGHAVSS